MENTTENKILHTIKYSDLFFYSSILKLAMILIIDLGVILFGTIGTNDYNHKTIIIVIFVILNIGSIMLLAPRILLHLNILPMKILFYENHMLLKYLNNNKKIEYNQIEYISYCYRIQQNENGKIKKILRIYLEKYYLKHDEWRMIKIKDHEEKFVYMLDTIQEAILIIYDKNPKIRGIVRVKD